jgi:hypothetical protein
MLAASASIRAESLDASLVNGVVTYRADDGTRKRLDVGKKCTDLWVAPDESALAFVGIDKSHGFYNDGEPFIEASTVYIARKADQLVPVRVGVTSVRVAGRNWGVFLHPSLSPGGEFVFFLVEAGNSWILFGHNLQTKKTDEIGWGVMDYCTFWKGSRAGEVLVRQRYLSDLATGGGFAYRCYSRAPGRRETPQACTEFGSFFEFGAACRQTP